MIIIVILSLLLAGGAVVYAIQTQRNCRQSDLETELRNDQLRQDNNRLETENAELLILKQKNVQLLQESEQRKNFVNCAVNELTEKQQKLQTELKNQEFVLEMQKKQEKETEARMLALDRSIASLSSSQEEAARAAFTKYCDALEYEYQKAETEYDGLIEMLKQVYNDEQDFLVTALTYEKNKASKDLEVIRAELEKIRATRAAAMEAQLREEEIKNQATFYTLQLNEADKRDVAYLQSIEYNLREARPLRMLIWSTFYRDKVNELAARVGAIGACGIYKLTHIESGISYIGQAKDIKERWVTHVKCSLGIDTPVTSQLYAFTREKGIDNFTFEILEKCNINELNEKEKFYIDLYQTYDFGLNKTRGNG